MDNQPTQIDTQLLEWRDEVPEAGFVGAQVVQDRLLDLYGSVRETPAGRRVEVWLGLTRHRQLFEGREIHEFLEQLQAELAHR
ncbi:MAG: hypothetical protein ACRD0F_06355 [Acidimicrobiales bacterium]